jgi:hypothetical protein
MPNDDMPANARPMPTDRRAFLRSVAAAGGATLTLSTAAIAEAATPPAIATFDLPAALARWGDIWAKLDAALKQADVDVWTPPKPAALRVREDDRLELSNLQDARWEGDNPFFPHEYARDAADEIRRWKKEGRLYWGKDAARLSQKAQPWLQQARRRAEEILVTFDEWDEQRKEIARESSVDVDEADAAVGEAMWERKDLEDEVMHAPVSAETIALKLRIFADCWRQDQEGNEAATIDDLDDSESPAARAAVAIALDLVTLARASVGGAPNGVFRSLGDVVMRVLRPIEEARA